MRELVTALDPRELTLVGHDWGGFIGLRLAAENPHLFARIVVYEADPGTGDEPVPDGMRQWQRLSQEMPVFHDPIPGSRKRCQAPKASLTGCSPPGTS